MRLKNMLGLLLIAAASFSSAEGLMASEDKAYETILRNRDTEAFEEWKNNKYSMFIHFGLYSELGGVWDGKPVEWGYSEQIQSFAGIFSDWYAMTADRFDPKGFDAREIVSLAKRAGMRSIVITTKHHDGFCLFKTETTDFNSVDATPSGRDFIKEMAEACKEEGIHLGLYFSVIDWHYPQAAPISSHNCDFITPEHHELNKAQIRELLTNYGKISELWFDMGSQLPEQSEELYNLVHELQPDCLVSGRIGNDYYDFAVMGDNRYPDSSIHAPWQSAASMFDETWGYRSWQERGEVSEKAAEKMRSLIDVVSHGGNYLLNIGPKGDGSVVDFEEDVLCEIGKWLEKNGEAIYNTEASPFDEEYEWGKITRKDNFLYLILSGKKTSKINLDIVDNDLLYVVYLNSKDVISYKQSKKGISLKLPVTGNRETTDIPVVKMSFKDDIERHASETLEARKDGFTLNAANAVKEYSYSCFDYYSNYKSVIGYDWNVFDRSFDKMELVYTEADIDKEICIEIDGEPFYVTLNDKDYDKQALPAELACQQQRYLQLGTGIFDADISKVTEAEGWTGMDSDHARKSSPFTSHFIMQKINAPEACNVIFEYKSGNGTEVLVNGKVLAKYLNPYRTLTEENQIIIPLKKGENTILLRTYNRFEKEVDIELDIDHAQKFYRMTVDLDRKYSDSSHNVRMTSREMKSPHSNIGLHNITLKLK